LKTDFHLCGKLNPHGILNPLIDNQEIGRWVIIPWIEGQNTMGTGFDIPWVGVKIPWISDQHIRDRGSKYHG
jgi:hypothetical protein